MRPDPGHCARVQVGELEVAIPVAAIAQALDVMAPQRFPRRAGAVCEAVSTRWGVLPLVDLALWQPCGTARTEGARVLVLRDETGRALALRVSALRGVLPPASLTRLHQDERPEELFQSAVCWRAGEPLAALLEVPRLMALSALWAQALHVGEAPQAKAGAADPVDRAGRAGAAGGTSDARVLVPHAVLRAGGAHWAVPALRLVQALPAPPLEYTLPAGLAVRGITSLHGRKLPVVNLAAWGRHWGGALHSQTAPGPSAEAEVKADAARGTHPLLGVLAQGALRLGLQVDAVRQLVYLPVPAAGAAPPEALRRVFVPELGEVQVIDVDQLFAQLPEADISRPRGSVAAPDPGAATAALPQPRERPAVPAHLLFESDATYAAHVRDLLHVLPLPAPLGAQLQTDAAATLVFRGEPIPVVALPAFCGGAAEGPPRVALVVRLPSGQNAALAVRRLLGWVGGAALQPGGMRTAASGQMPIVTVAREGRRSSHVVVDLAEVALALT